jgi:hypothetical protein
MYWQTISLIGYLPNPQFPKKISYVLFRCTLQDVRITPLVTENNTKEGERQRKKEKN